MTGLTVEYMRQLEASLTPEQMDRAIAIYRANGWKSEDSSAPMWVWQQIFLEAKAYIKPASRYQNNLNQQSI